MSHGVCCPNVFQRLRNAFSALKRKGTGAGLAVRRMATLGLKDFEDALAESQVNEKSFLSTLIQPINDSVYIRLYQLEAIVDKGKFVEILSSLSREEIDLQVPYEYQNVRAYLYYLSVKARVRDYQTTFKFSDLVNQNLYSYNPETIIFHIRESARYMCTLTFFLPYCQASVDFDLTQSIFIKRINILNELQAEIFRLLFFILVHNDQFLEATSTQELVSVLKYFDKANASYQEKMEEAKVSFDFDTRGKIIAKTLIPAIVALFEITFLPKNASYELMLKGLIQTRFFLGKFKVLDALEGEEFCGRLEEEISRKLEQLKEIIGTGASGVKSADEVSVGKREKFELGLTRAMTGDAARGLNELSLGSFRMLPKIEGGEELTKLMKQPSISMGNPAQKASEVEK